MHQVSVHHDQALSHRQGLGSLQLGEDCLEQHVQLVTQSATHLLYQGGHKPSHKGGRELTAHRIEQVFRHSYNVHYPRLAIRICEGNHLKMVLFKK